jgi:hypothetical protein
MMEVFESTAAVPITVLTGFLSRRNDAAEPNPQWQSRLEGCRSGQ